MKRRIVSVGEAMVEMAPDAVAGRYVMGFAGDTLNTAWYLRRQLGQEWAVDYLSAVGCDAVSERMTAFLAAEGIGVEHVARIAGRTVGLYLIELRDGERSFAYWRGQSAARLLAQDPARLTAAFSGADVIYFSGITLAVLDGSGSETLLRAVAQARASGAMVVFDPNLRPVLWPDSQTMCRAVMRAAALVDVVLPSFDDEAMQFADADPWETADRYAAAGAGLVVVKNGGGEIVVRKGAVRSQHQPVAVARVVDSTAAGDSFNAGFLSAWVQGADLAEAVRAGAGLAARVIGQRGALCAD